MGSLCRSRTRNKTSSSTTQEKWVTQGARGIFGDAQQAAAPNQFTRQAGQMAMQTDNPFMQRAQGLAGNLTGTYDMASAQPYMNFFEQNVANPQMQAIDSTLANTANRINSRYSGSGLSGYRNVLGQQAAAAEAGRAKAGILGSARQAGLQFGANQYAQGLQRNQAAAGLLGQLGGQQQNIQASQIANLLRQGNLPLQRQAQLAQILAGLPRNQYGTGTQTQSQSSNVFGSLVGAAGTAASAYFGGGM